VPGLRSLRNRLAVIFALIIIGAIGTIYLSVTPRLEASLTSQRLDQVRASATQYTPELARFLVPPRAFYGDKDVPILKDGTLDQARIRADRNAAVRRFAERVGTEIIVMSDRPGGAFLLTDSTPDGGATSRDVQEVTREAIRTNRHASAVVTTANGRMTLAAQPINDPAVKDDYVVVFTDSLADVQDNVALIRRQVLISGGIALVIAILAG